MGYAFLNNLLTTAAFASRLAPMSALPYTLIVVWMVGATRHRLGKNPAIRCRYSMLAPVEHDLGQVRM